jgi:hypothetical protein
VARIVAQLDASRGDDGTLLPRFTALNVNYPAVPSSDLKGVVWAKIGCCIETELLSPCWNPGTFIF